MSENEKNQNIPEEMLGTEIGAAYFAGLEAEPVLIADTSVYAELAPGVAFVRTGYTQVDLSRHLKAPTRVNEERHFRSTQSFTDYIEDFDGVGEQRLYANLVERKVRAVLDDHYVLCKVVDSEAPEPSEVVPSWCDHVAIFSPQFSSEYLPWKNFNDKPLKQLDFGEFLEDNAAAITSIDAASLKEMVMDLEVVRTTSFKQATNQANGNIAFEFVETDKDGNTKGQHQVSLPRFIEVTFPIFEHGPTVTMNAVLRYRLNGSELTFHFKLSRLKQVEDAAFNQLLDQIRDDGHRILI
jgi:uncharacterized protein YfdQ (DUF2303 family)